MLGLTGAIVSTKWLEFLPFPLFLKVSIFYFPEEHKGSNGEGREETAPGAKTLFRVVDIMTRCIAFPSSADE